MTRFLKDKSYILFLVLALTTLLPFFGRLFNHTETAKATNELFRPELTRLNSVDKIVAYTDSVYAAQVHEGFDTVLYTRILSQLIKERFCHGTLDYSFSENWIACLSGKLIWNHMSSIVIPEDILKHQQGLCSQQTIVLMKVLREKNINVRSVGLGYKEGPGHFLCEIMYNGSWHLHDVSVEPIWRKLAHDHCSLNYYLTKRDSLFVAYESRLPKDTFYKLLEKTSYGEVNKIPASNMALFHKATFVLMYTLPLFFLFMALRSFRRRSAITKSEEVASVTELKKENESLIAF